jgi:hypothetical protein
LLRRRLDACGSQHRRGGPLRYQQGHCDIPCDVGDMNGLCDVLGNCSGGCDFGQWSRREKKPKVNDADFDALRARVEEAKRKNLHGR